MEINFVWRHGREDVGLDKIQSWSWQTDNIPDALGDKIGPNFYDVVTDPGNNLKDLFHVWLLPSWRFDTDASLMYKENPPRCPFFLKP